MSCSLIIRVQKICMCTTGLNHKCVNKKMDTCAFLTVCNLFGGGGDGDFYIKKRRRVNYSYKNKHSQ